MTLPIDDQLLISHGLLGSFVGSIAPWFVRRYAAELLRERVGSG